MVEEPESGLVTDPSKFKHQSVEEIKKGGKRDREQLAVAAERKREREDAAAERRIEREEAGIVRDKEFKEELIEAVAEGTREGTTLSARERRLWGDEEYREFQNSERWCNTRLEIGTQIIQPDFWREASHEQKRIYEYRAELARAVFVKRTTGFTLENQANNPDLAGFSKAETAALYDVPGVRLALETYVKYIDNADAKADAKNERFMPKRKRDKGKKKPTRVSVLTIQDRDDAEQIRKQITEKEIAPILEVKLRQKYQMATKEELKILRKKAMRMAIDAEQIALNLLYVGNTFESLDSRWDEAETRRLRKPSLMAAEFISPPIKYIMNPTDALVVKSARGTERLKTVGAYGEWAQKQIADALIKAGAKKDGLPNYDAITHVEVIPTGSGKEKAKWWTAEKMEEEEVKLNVPDCYPVKLMKSIWEETRMEPREDQIKSKDKDGKKPLLDFLREGEEIPWEKPQAAGMWTDYADSIRASDVIWQYFRGEHKIVFKKFGALSEWQENIARSLAQYGWAEETVLKRWLFYASTGVDGDSRLPKASMSKHQKETIQMAMGKDGVNFLDKEEIFFQWDKLGFSLF